MRDRPGRESHVRALVLPAHYQIEGTCAACRAVIRASDNHYRIGDNLYHANCFDLSLFGPEPRP
jgi:hypothetical protein